MAATKAEAATDKERRRSDIAENIVEEARRSITALQPAEARMDYWNRLLPRKLKKDLLQVLHTRPFAEAAQGSIVEELSAVNDPNPLGDLLGNVEGVGRHEDRHALFWSSRI